MSGDIPPEEQPEVPQQPAQPPADQPAEAVDLGPEVDEDFPTYANEANKELNRKVNSVTKKFKGERKTQAIKCSEIRKRRARRES